MWQKEINLCPHSYTKWKIVHPSLLTRKMVGGGRPLLSEIFGQTDPVPPKTSIFNRILLVACTSAVTPIAKKLSLIENPLRDSKWAHDDQRALSLSPQKGAQNVKWPFSGKKCSSRTVSLRQLSFLFSFDIQTLFSQRVEKCPSKVYKRFDRLIVGQVF